MLANLVNKIKKYFKIACAVFLLGVAGYYLYKHNVKVDKNISSTVLPTNDQAKIIINEAKHTITTVTSKGSTTQYLSSTAAIEVGKNGIVKVIERTWGFEKAPYAGFGYSNGLRGQVGMDWFYWHRFDVGAGLQSDFKNLNTTAANLNISYNFYSHTSIAMSYSTDRMIGVFLKFRF